MVIRRLAYRESDLIVYGVRRVVARRGGREFVACGNFDLGGDVAWPTQVTLASGVRVSYDDVVGRFGWVYFSFLFGVMLGFGV